MSVKTLQEKNKSTQSSFLNKSIHKTKTIADVHLIAKHFNSYFTEIGPNLANKIEKSSKNFKGYIKKCNNIQSEHQLSINEVKDAFHLCAFCVFYAKQATFFLLDVFMRI